MPTELMENSSYIGRIVRHSFGESKNGNPQLGITFELLGRVNPMDPDGELLACEGVERTMFWTFTEKTMEWLPRDLARIGYNKSSFRFLDPNDPQAHSFEGVEIPVYFTLEEYKGKWKERWALSSGQQTKPVEAKKLRELDAMFGKNLRAAVSQNAPAPAPVVAPVAATNVDPAAVGEDEIPF